jgi:asparagine synthase (glutamine-hydrolysing)
VCGIAGFTHLNKPPAERRIRQAIETLRHRGPDQQGVFHGASVSLGAVRLKIIDLAGGDQPIQSDDRDTVIVFNGEIYNHRDLRAELERLGRRFHSRCDTEVVLHAFQQWGRDCLPRLRGMFALAIWKASERLLLLARDRLGIKPLYFSRQGDDVYFGSELKALLVHPEVARRIDPVGLHYYLSLNYVPGPYTLIEGIEKLRPGCWLEWRNGYVQTGPYWRLPVEPREDWTIEAAKQELDRLLDASVREHLAADVPLGVWSSGGLDSSTVLHYAARASSRKLNTFSVSFAGRSFDESRYFRLVSSAYGTEHHEFDLNPESGLVDAIEDLAYYSDEPSADAGALPVWFLSKMCRRSVTVALSGEGADELFGGYVTYLADRMAARLRLAPRAARRLALRALDYWPASNEKISFEYKLKRFLAGSLLSPEESHMYWNGTFSEAEKRELYGGEGHGPVSLLFEVPFQPPAVAGRLARYLWFDQKFYLPDDILTKCDRMSMAHSLEVRPPFLDHRIVEFAASLPVRLKIHGNTLKYVLRELMKDKLPAAVLRRKKEGFDIPIHDWFRGPLRPLLLDTLTERTIAHSGLVRAEGGVAHRRPPGRARQLRISPMGPRDPVSVAAALEGRHVGVPDRGIEGPRQSRRFQLIVVAAAAAIFLGGILSPPSLMDDVDAVQAQIARNMLESGDWVTARLNGVAYLEKAPLKYWMIAVSYMIFGIHDWAARIPIALGAILLAWVTSRFGAWAFSETAGLVAGLAAGCSVGLFLFTRILIPDVLLTLAITVGLWSLLRALEEDEPHPRLWASLLAVSIAAGLLLKGLIAGLFTAGVGFVYLLMTRQLTVRRTWRRLRPWSGLAIILLIAAPWHVLAILANPPYFDFTMRSERGAYHGFFWFYFLNEHVFRFLNMRYPRDYNTVPRLLFWALHLVWLFPFSTMFPAAARLGFKPLDRGGRTRLLALAWTGFILTFFTFSTTQEYYSMPCYPALALLTGAAVARGGAWVRGGFRAVSAVALAAAAITGSLWFLVRNHPAPGDISSALTQNPDVYTLSLGHMFDLTLSSFAYLRLPLLVATAAFLVGAAGAWRTSGLRPVYALAAMMILFTHAARMALVTFDPYLSSRPLAEALAREPEGRLILDDQYYTFSSVVFYTNKRVLLLNGRVNNLEYGSYAPGAPDVFLDDAGFQKLWRSPERFYLAAAATALPRLERLVGKDTLRQVAAAGGKHLFTNR